MKKRTHHSTFARRTLKTVPLAAALLLVLAPAAPSWAAPEGSRSKTESVKRHKAGGERSEGRSYRSEERRRSPRAERDRGRDERRIERYKRERTERYQDDRRDDRRDHRYDRRDHRRDHRYDRYDRRDNRRDHRYDRYDRHDRYDHRDRHRYDHRYRAPYRRGTSHYYHHHVRRPHRHLFELPRVIFNVHLGHYDPYYWGRVYHGGHHHYHAVYAFPVYVDDALLYRPYSYCEGEFYATGYFSVGGPHFDLTLRF